MKCKLVLYFFITTISTAALKAQAVQFTDSVFVESKIWSRDSARNIQYSDWKKFASHTIDMIKGYSAPKEDRVCAYGGNLSVKQKASGFFRTEKINGRWMLIDPDGHAFMVSAINGIRQGKSPNNEKAFEQKFGSSEKWMAISIPQFQQAGFNTAGSWSDLAAIIEYNKTAAKPFAYTTQLSLLSGYIKEAIQLEPSRKKSSTLSFIIDAAFAVYCQKQAMKLIASKNDANLLGHFSDNEIAFTATEFNNIISTNNKSDKCYQLAQQWMKDKAVNEQTISKEQKEIFIGMLTGIYYKTVATAIKQYDPNHLYIGSRLHSSAKNNPYIFQSAEPYIDIISINYYGYWQPQKKQMEDWAAFSNKPFFITEYYTKAEDSGMPNISGAGWLVKTQSERGIHYQNFCIELLRAKNCVGWHWFRYQDNDPSDASADPSNNDSNKGIVNTLYEPYPSLIQNMQLLNNQKYQLIKFFDRKK